MDVQADQVRVHLEKILASRVFVRSGRLARFLRFLVTQGLVGEAGKLKEYALGIDVFDRDSDYDQRFDPIVRVEARRLRIKLQEYYEKEGQADPVRIELAARGYVPVFRSTPARPRPAASKVTLAVLPFFDLSDGAVQNCFADGLTDELICALGSLGGLRVVARTSVLPFREKRMDVRRIGADLNVDYVIEGSVRREQRRRRVCAQLIETRDGLSVWSRVEDHDSPTTLEAQQQIAAGIVIGVRDWLVLESHAQLDAFRPHPPGSQYSISGSSTIYVAIPEAVYARINMER